MAVHLNPSALATLVLLLSGEGGGRAPKLIVVPPPPSGALARVAVFSREDKCTEGGHGEAVSEQPPKGKGEAALFSPHEDRTMPEKSNNGSSKDNDRWKVKAIPFPPVGGEEGHGLPGIPARRAVSSLGRQQSDFAAAHSRRME
ncbi:hypothetical protein MTO96_013881 [Rhipicephalus appendiculatus]